MKLLNIEITVQQVLLNVINLGQAIYDNNNQMVKVSKQTVWVASSKNDKHILEIF
jgi:hypothetical protein